MKMNSGRASLRLDQDPGEIAQWKLAETSDIQWVRLVRDRGGMFGIGFFDDQLIYFLGGDVPSLRCQLSGIKYEGLVRRVSAFESMVLLRCLAGRELNLQPDVESNPIAWRRWLRRIIAEFGFRTSD